MAKLILSNGNRGVYGYNEIGKYEPVRVETNAAGNQVITYEYDADTHGASDVHPATLVLEIEDLLADRQFNLTEGTVVSLKFLNESGNVVLRSSGLSFDVAELNPESESIYHFYYKMISEGFTFIGSNNSRADDDWDGDVISTGEGNDIVRARGGNDVILDGGGQDRYIGGEGSDRVHYNNEDAGIVANLARGWVRDGDGVRDRLISIERVRGTEFRDKMTGDEEDNQFQGLAGNDLLIGGGGDRDRADYSRDANYGGSAGIVANMARGTVVDGFGDRDRIESIEEIRGTDSDDKFFDNGGRDGYMGAGGDDLFVFRGGNDWAEGGDGADTFKFSGAFGYDWIGDFDQSEGDRIKIAGMSSMDDVEISEDSNGNARIDYGDNTIALSGVDQNEVDASYFLL
jgi:hypothetical protein